MKLPFLKRVEDAIRFDGEHLEIYIPKTYFAKGIAEYFGDRVKTIGMFDFLYFPDGKGAIAKGELHTFKLPMNISFEFDNYYDTSVKLKPEMPKEDYTVYELSRGQLFMDSVIKELSAENSKKFIGLLHGGNLPPTLKYTDIIKLYHESIGINKVKLNNPSVIFEMIIAELYRSKEKPELPFRMVIGKDGFSGSEFDYTAIDVKKLPSINSTFNAMTFEDIDQAIISSIKKTRNNETENESPIEKIIKY